MPNRLLPGALFAALTLTTAMPAAAQVDVDGAMLQRDMNILAADDMEGREAGTRGHERAAGYVAGRMAALGLEPAGGDGTYFQAVPMLRYASLAEGSGLSIEGMAPMTHGTEFVAAGTAQQETGSITGRLVFIGYGLDIPGRDDFAGVDLEGAIAVRAYGGPEGLNTEESAHFRSSLNERLSARGAIGVLLVYTPELTDRYTFEDLAADWDDEDSMTWIGPDGRAYQTGPGILASGVLSPEASRALFAGQAFSYDDLIAAEATPEARLPSFDFGRSATIDWASEFEVIDTPNVIGLIPGSDPALADQYIVLTAHLDHVGIQPTEEAGDDEIYNGALDNAVGVASMLEVARLLAADPPARPVLVIALTAEENGLIGSSYNAANPTVPASQVVANVNLDMPVITYAFTDVVAFGAERSNLYPAVVAATQEYGIALTPDPQPEQSFFVRSDQYSYVRRGVPAVYLDLGWGNNGEAEQEVVYENHYHEPSDEVGLIDWEALNRFTGLNYLIARNIADMAARPAWNAGDFFGTTYGGVIAAPQP